MNEEDKKRFEKLKEFVRTRYRYRDERWLISKLEGAQAELAALDAEFIETMINARLECEVGKCKELTDAAKELAKVKGQRDRLRDNLNHIAYHSHSSHGDASKPYGCAATIARKALAELEKE